MDIDPIEALRAELALRGVSLSQQPNEEMLRVMLDVEHGSVTRAARAISDAQIAEDRHSNSSSMETARATNLDDPEGTGTDLNFTSAGHAIVPGRSPRNLAQESVWEKGWLIKLWRVIALPFTLVQAAMFFFLRSLGIVRPLPRGASGRFEPSRYTQDPRESARNWISELERDTGCSCEMTDLRSSLLPFYAGSYADALLHAKQQIQILMIVLTSKAHSDDHFFKTHVLTDSRLVDLIRQSQFTVWGGDVHDREAYQVSTLLKTTTYPFVAFVALQPRRSRSRGAVVAHPAVLSRLEGSPHTTLSAQSLVSHINEVLLPRTATYLGELRGDRDHRQMERQLKADQDRAYAEASRRDQDRVLARRAEETQIAEAQRAKLAQEAQRKSLQEKQSQWRQWARHHLVPAEPSQGTDSIRISVHLPNGQNLQRKFAPSHPLEAVYAFVETANCPEEDCNDPPAEYKHTYAFHLVQTYPRQVLSPTDLSQPLQSFSCIGKSANLVVEGPLHQLDDPSESSDASSQDL
ncbi:UBX domain-containing protein 10 [Malassezia yamatoensis]|uniref:UBX domain-containing protein 10 n=1 Tax=Malassezia yamatoensis TaxID=253288 RepID=A0AAJ6CJ89_9BASI|nr:UBX domain-containing protein 10 [Malassezia yamatoensis]